MKNNNENIWITLNDEEIVISELEDSYLSDIDNTFSTLFKRLINIKIEIFKRKFLKYF